MSISAYIQRLRIRLFNFRHHDFVQFSLRGFFDPQCYCMEDFRCCVHQGHEFSPFADDAGRTRFSCKWCGQAQS